MKRPSVFNQESIKNDEDDWEKLKSVLLWCKNTVSDPRIIGTTTFTNISAWIDAAYSVHPDMKNHSGGIMSMGAGALHSKSSLETLNTKSSTKAEIVGVSEYLPYNILMMHECARI